jgi:hypothetical protein
MTARNQRDAKVRAAFSTAFAAAKRDGAIPRRHRSDVTADRLADDVSHWHALLDGAESDAAGMVIQALREIADGTRS